MIGATPIIHSLGGGPLRLVSAGALSGGLSLTRASTALAAAADGITMLSYAANAPRFQGAAQRLLVEGARTNGVRNPRGEGAAATGGSGLILGTNPTNWTRNSSVGITSTIVGSGTESGIPYVDIRFAGTASAASSALNWSAEAPSGCAAANGDTWTSSWHGTVVAGSLSGISSVNTQIYELSSAAAILASTPGTWVPGSGALRNSRFSLSRTFNNASTAFTRTLHYLVVASGAVVDVTIRYGGPQYELAGFASSLILPPAGSPAAATRAADVATYALGSAQVARGSLVGTFMLPTVSTGAADVQGLLVLDDGTDGNRFGLRKPGGAATLQPFRSVSGTLTSGSSIQTLAPGVAFRAALAWDASGIVACCNGGAVVSLARAIPSVNRLLVGHGASTLGQGAFGEVGPLDLHPTRLPDATLQALTLN